MTNDSSVSNDTERIRQYIASQETLKEYNIRNWRVYDRDHVDVLLSTTGEEDKYAPLDDRYKDIKIDLDYMTFSFTTRTERKRKFKELLTFVPFVILACCYCYSVMNFGVTYYMHNGVKDALIHMNFPQNYSLVRKTYLDIDNAEDYFDWMDGVLLPALYNEDNRENYLTTSNRLVGSLRIRQVRTSIRKRDQCLLVNRFNPVLPDFDPVCYPKSKPWSRDPFPQNATSDSSIVWRYKTCDQIGGGTVYIGRHINIPCDGYSSEIPFNRTLNEARLLLNRIQSSYWIDKQSRALVHEFFSYNANLYYFTSTKLAIEITNGGSYIPTYEIRSFRLYPMNTTRDIVLMVFGMISIVYLANLFVSLIIKVGSSVCNDIGLKLPSVQAILSCNQDILDDVESGDDEQDEQLQQQQQKVSATQEATSNINRIISRWTWHEHFFSIWNWIDIALILLGCMSYILRLMAYASPRRKLIQVVDIDHYPKQLEYFLLIYKLDATVCCILIIVAFFKVFKYFSLNDRLNLLAITMARAWKGLFVVGITMIICLLAFAFSGYINFGYDFYQYRTFTVAFSTLLRSLLGNFSYEDLRAENRRLFPFFFIAFMTVGYLVIMNMFLAVVNEAFSDSSKQTLDNDLGYRPTEMWKHAVNRIRYAARSEGGYRVTKLSNHSTNYFDQGDEEIISRLRRYCKQTGKLELTLEDVKFALGNRAGPALVNRVMTRFDKDKSGSVDLFELEHTLAETLKERKNLATKAGKSSAAVKENVRKGGEKHTTPPQQINEIDEYVTSLLESMSRIHVNK